MGQDIRTAQFLVLYIVAALCVSSAASAQQKPANAGRAEPRSADTFYRIDLDLNFDGRSYAGVERVRWTNRGGATSILYLNLYPNLRAPVAREKTPPDRAADVAAPGPTPDEPGLEVSEVRAGGQALAFVLEDGVSMRVHLREVVAAGGSAELEIKFKGRVPELDPDETSLPAHLIQQVGAALRATPEVRSARHLNFYSRGVMLLGSPFPLLAVRDGNEWRRRTEATIGDFIHTDLADYEVNVRLSDDGTKLFSSGGEEYDVSVARNRHVLCRGQNLRGFALLAGRTLRAAERETSGVRVRSVYAPEHERTGLHVLDVSAEAVRVFTDRFGPLPFKSVTVAEAPLTAGLGSTEFAGLSTIASAFYVDFDSPAMRGLPEIVREQRASVEDSLEFAAAHMVAHQWWGAAVGSDPSREPVADEALAHWSALLYYREARGEARAQAALEDQLRGVYQVYRSFGGEDMPADRPAREYRNSFQYAAVVASKGALMLETLKGVMGATRFMRGLRNYYETQRLRNVVLGDLRKTLSDESDTQQRRMVARVFDRWLTERHGDEDIAPPNPQLAAALGVSVERPEPNDRNAFSRLGRFFWRQMTRIR